MRATRAQPHTRDLNVGDRIAVWQVRQSLLALIGRAGTVIEVFRAPFGSCLVRLDNDGDRRREWFFYRDEVRITDV